MNEPPNEDKIKQVIDAVYEKTAPWKTDSSITKERLTEIETLAKADARDLVETSPWWKRWLMKNRLKNDPLVRKFIAEDTVIKHNLSDPEAEHYKAAYVVALFVALKIPLRIAVG